MEDQKYTKEPYKKTYTQEQVNDLLHNVSVKNEINSLKENTDVLFKRIENELKEISLSIKTFRNDSGNLNKRLEAIEREADFQKRESEIRRQEVIAERELQASKLTAIYQRVGIISAIGGLFMGTVTYAIIHFLIFHNL